MDFIQENFIFPLLRNGWFNPYNTITYGVGLIIGFFIVLKILKALKVKPDSKLMAALIPYIIMAGATRAIRDFIYNKSVIVLSDYNLFLTDIGYNYSVIQEQAYLYFKDVVPGPIAWVWSYIVAWFPTPGSYFITFFIALLVMIIAVAWEKRGGKEYWKTLGFTGIALAAFSVYLLPVKNPLAIGLVALFFTVWTGLFLGMRYFIHSDTYLKRLRKDHRKSVKSLFSWTNTGIVSAHLLDASATFTALTFYGFSEQHVLPRTVMPLLGPVSMFIMKIAVVLPVLWLIDNYADDDNFKGLLKLVILILGLAPGIRDLLTLALV